MGNFILFFKKETVELIKTVKGVVLVIIFIFIAISSPILAKLTPEIMKWAADSVDNATTSSDAQSAMNALTSLVPPPTSDSSYAQFFSNFNQIGLLALIIVFAGIVANEKSKNTASYILTQNISRRQFILSKFASCAVFTIVSVIIAMACQILYTNILFDDKNILFQNVMLYSVMLFLYLIFILTIVMFSSVVSKSVTPATFVAFLIFIVFNILTAVPKIGKYMPPEINNFGILTQTKSLGDLAVNIMITVVCSAVFLIASLELFNRQEL